MHIEPFGLERYFAKYEFEADYLLGSSDCESIAIRDLLTLDADAHERFDEQWLGYTESAGSPSLREAICSLYESQSADDILVHSGAEEAIFLLLHSVLNNDDHVIVHTPCYQSLISVAHSTGAEVTRWEAREDNEWALDLRELEPLLRPNTALVVVNTPHNPTGYLMAEEDLLALSELLRSRDVLLFVDEVYRESEHNPDDRLPAACDLGEHAISLSVMSKTYGLAGLRIGWLATSNREVRTKVAMFKDYTTICNSAPSEFLAELALRHRHTIVERNLSIIRDNLATLDDFFARHSDAFTWQRPKAGAIAFPAYHGVDVERFCTDLVEGTGVMLVPGLYFGDDGNHFRIGFGRKNMPQAVERLEDFLAGYR